MNLSLYVKDSWQKFRLIFRCSINSPELNKGYNTLHKEFLEKIDGSTFLENWSRLKILIALNFKLMLIDIKRISIFLFAWFLTSFSLGKIAGQIMPFSPNELAITKPPIWIISLTILAIAAFPAAQLSFYFFNKLHSKFNLKLV